MKTENPKENLCNTCNQEIANCKNENIVFGNGTGKDNVIECSEYKKEPTQEEKLEEQRQKNIDGLEWDIKYYMNKIKEAKLSIELLTAKK